MIVFYAGFFPAVEVQKSVMFYTLLSFSQITQGLEPDILSMVFLNDSSECYSKDVVA